LQIASNVDNLIALALPFFNTEILAIVMPTLSASSVTLIFRFASITSMLMMIATVLARLEDKCLAQQNYGSPTLRQSTTMHKSPQPQRAPLTIVGRISG
jgi:hypothetical protein